MAKRILIISSSPRRKGNSDTLCDEFMRGAIEAGHEVEKIFYATKELSIAPVAAHAVFITSLVRRKMMLPE